MVMFVAKKHLDALSVIIGSISGYLLCYTGKKWAVLVIPMTIMDSLSTIRMKFSVCDITL